MNAVLDKVAARHVTIKMVPYDHQYRDQTLAIAHEIHAESIYHDLPLDEEKVIRQLACCGGVVPDRYFKLAVRNGEVLGGFFGHYRRTFFCDEILAHDMGWWVRRDKRGSAAAVVMLLDFEQWALEHGAKKVMVGQSTGRNIEVTTKLYEHCGFRVIGYNTVKDI